MKTKRIITTAVIITILVVIAAFRLVSNKRSFDEQLKMVSEFNTVIPVITDTAKYEQQLNGISINGSFQASHEISITAETQGKIVSILAGIGDNVKTGQVLASVDNVLLASQLEMTKFNLEKAEKDMQRFETLSKADAISTQQYEAVKQVLVNAQFANTSAKVQYENSFIKVPFNGIITKRYIEKGSYLAPGMPVFDIVEINKLKFIANLTVDEFEKVKKGQTVNLSVDDYPGISYIGTVSSIVVKADLSKRYTADIEVENRTDKYIKPGMYGTAIFTNHSGNQILTIPRKAIAGSIKNPEVFVVKADSVILQSIEVEPINDKYVAVKKGLKAGDVIVISGQINLVNGSKIKINK